MKRPREKLWNRTKLPIRCCVNANAPPVVFKPICRRHVPAPGLTAPARSVLTSCLDERGRREVVNFRQRERQKFRGLDFLIVIQRKRHDFGVAGVSAMNGSTTVAQVSLCFAFRHASGTGPLCPSCIGRMKGHAADASAMANFAKMTGAHRPRLATGAAETTARWMATASKSAFNPSPIANAALPLHGKPAFAARVIRDACFASRCPPRKIDDICLASTRFPKQPEELRDNPPSVQTARPSRALRP